MLLNREEMKQLLMKDFGTSLQRKICEDVISATKTCAIFFRDNQSFFSYSNYGSLRGELISYAVTKELYDSAFSPKAAYQAEPLKVNNYNRSILHINTENFVTTVAKTGKANQLPCKSKYKKAYAVANSHCDGQMYFSINDMLPIDPKYYSIITYGYNTTINECTHINILIPSASFKETIVNMDLKSKYIPFILEEPKKVDEEKITKLHEEYERLIKLKIE
jgi:hypothetical protein